MAGLSRDERRSTVRALINAAFCLVKVVTINEVILRVIPGSVYFLGMASYLSHWEMNGYKSAWSLSDARNRRKWSVSTLRAAVIALDSIVGIGVCVSDRTACGQCHRSQPPGNVRWVARRGLM